MTAGSKLLLAATVVLSSQVAGCQTGDAALREYAGNYQWGPDAFVYLQPWAELSGDNQLVAIDESGEVRALYSAARDSFTAGPGAAVPKPVESTVTFQRDGSGKIVSLTWARAGTAPRVAKRVDTERREDVSFSNGNVKLAGTLVRPSNNAKVPAIVLVHASGAEDREYLLPLAHFLVRHVSHYSATTNAASGNRPAIGRRRRTKTSWVTWLRRSII